MKISKATIRETAAPALDGSFTAFVLSEKCLKTVCYTSPFRAGESGGILFPPVDPQTILVCKPDGSDDDVWYYLSTVYEKPKTSNTHIEKDFVKGTLKADAEKVDKNLYRSRGLPMRNTIGSAGGHKLLLSDEYGTDPRSEEPIDNRRLEVKTMLGKVLKFLDSTGQDTLYLTNEHRDGIKITSSDTDPFSAAQSIEIESRGPQKQICRESQMDMLVNEGRELNLVNNSNGVWKNIDYPEKYGNINIESRNRDINLNCLSDTGRIFIQCLSGIPDASGSVPTTGQLIEIETKNETSIIRIFGKGSVEVHADSDITLEAGTADKIGNINMAANGKIKINGQQGVDIDAGAAANVELNSGKALNVIPDQIVQEPNHYDDGVIY